MNKPTANELAIALANLARQYENSTGQYPEYAHRLLDRIKLSAEAGAATGMKISDVMTRLSQIASEYGNLPATIQEDTEEISPVVPVNYLRIAVLSNPDEAGNLFAVVIEAN